MKVKVNVSLDVVLGFCTHWGPFSGVGPQFSIEGCTQYWPPGTWIHQNKLAATVKHRYLPLVQQGHNIGMLMPHVTVPLWANPWYVKIYSFSGCKVVFGVARVKAEKSPIGCAGAMPFLPMLTCGEPVSLPTAIPVTSWRNSVLVKMSGWDLLAGFATILISMAVDAMWSIIGGKSGAPKGYNPYSSWSVIKNCFNRTIFKTLGSQLLKSWSSAFFKSAIKGALNSLAGLTMSALQGSPTLTVSANIPLVASGKLTLTTDPAASKSLINLPFYKHDSRTGWKNWKGEVLGAKKQP